MKSWLKRASALVLVLGLVGQASAQQAPPVQTQPSSGNSGEASSTIASSSLFQLVWAASTPPQFRRGCLILNNSTHQQWVYFQGPGMATPTSGNFSTIKAESVPLNVASAANAAGGWVSCGTGDGVVLQDAVWIGGTISDTYVAKQQ